nr:unnamed protein product [Callosobruchus chinensis]
MQEYALRKFPSCSSLYSLCRHGSEEHPYCKKCAKGQLNRSKRLLRHDSSLELYNILQGENSAHVDVRQESCYPLSSFPNDEFQSFLTYTAAAGKAFKNKACLCKPIVEFTREQNEHTAPMPMPTHPKKEKKKVCPLFRRKKKLDRHDMGTNVSDYGDKSTAGGGEGTEDSAKREIKIILCGGACGSSTATNTIATHSFTSMAVNSNSLEVQDAPSKTDNVAPEETAVVACEDFSGGPYASVSLKSHRGMRDQSNQVPIILARSKTTCIFMDKCEQTHPTNDVNKTRSPKVPLRRRQITGVATESKCNCQEHVETLRMLIKMEAKQNYRLISNIMKELSYQRDEIRRMTDLYEDVVLNVGMSNSNRRASFGSDSCTAEAQCTKCRQCRAKETSKNMKDILNHSMKSDSFELSEKQEKSEKKKTGFLSMFNMYSQEDIEETISDDKSLKNCSKAVFCVQDVVTKQQSVKELKEIVENNRVECKSISCALNDCEAEPEEDKETFPSSCPVLKKLLEFFNFKRPWTHL